MKKRTVFLMIMFVLAMLLLSACVPGDETYTTSNPAGFFSGIWHGWIAPISLIIGLFDKSTRVYERLNTGWWYDFGFYIAVISGFGGLSLFRKNRSKKKDD